jgi:alkylation response protein AidB-like acyl-CoA dehydrogenase
MNELSRVGVPDDYNAQDDNSFRLMVRRWVEANYPPDIRNPPQRLHWAENKPWYFKLAEKGWLAPSWPREYGGMGLSAAKQLILIEEFERHGC